jgi:hypothetical protein
MFSERENELAGQLIKTHVHTPSTPSLQHDSSGTLGLARSTSSVKIPRLAPLNVVNKYDRTSDISGAHDPDKISVWDGVVVPRPYPTSTPYRKRDGSGSAARLHVQNLRF